jgi:hypothetical protein
MRRKSQVRFGGGRMEKEPQGYLASRLPNELSDDDVQENELSLEQGFRLLSNYQTGKGQQLWIITEADRSATTILLPSEY